MNLHQYRAELDRRDLDETITAIVDEVMAEIHEPDGDMRSYVPRDALESAVRRILKRAR